MIGALGGWLVSLLLAADCRQCPKLPSDPDRDPVRAAISEAYAQLAACPPCEDSVLSRAAQAIAAGSQDSLPSPVALQHAVQEAGGGDPSPRAMLLSARDPRALTRDLDQQWRPQAGDEVMGFGLAQTLAGMRLVVLAAQRKVSVEPLPARVAVGAEVRIDGVFQGALRSPSVYVEGPNGRVVQIKSTLGGSRFSARFEPTEPGSYVIEVLGQGSRGPEVAYLKSIEAGKSSVEVLPPMAEPTGRDDGAAVIDQINRERLKYGAAALSPDPRLAAVAQAYARELRELGIFAHVSPRSGDLKTRLKRAGYPFRSAAENLAQGPTALQAQALAASSPAHRRAMLDPEYTRCGIGLSRAISGDGSSDVLLVEVFALDGGRF